MSENSSIEWTDHTFNPWRGCTKISPACDNCYAATLARRFKRAEWGPDAARVAASEERWKEPVKWNRDAEARGERSRVFCLSMGDVFEKRSELDTLRARLWKLIEETPSLDWQLLTKRPGNILGMVSWTTTWPTNVWIGTTVEDQKWAARRLPLLVQVPAIVRFVSCEPLLETIDLTPWIGDLGWVIAGGESGAGARPMNLSSVRSLREQCIAANVPFFFKQWGTWGPTLMKLGKKKAGRELDGVSYDEMPRLATGCAPLAQQGGAR